MNRTIQYIIVVVALLTLAFCQGCVSSILAPESANLAEKAFYDAQGKRLDAVIAQNNKPMVQFTTPDGNVFTVNNPNPSPLPTITYKPSTFVQGANVILNSSVAKIVGGGWAAGYMLGKVQGNYSTGDNGSINVTRDSGNTVDVETKHVEEGGTISEESHTGSDYTADSHDAVSDPTIVTAPDPVIVTAPDPVVVQTEVVVVGGEE